MPAKKKAPTAKKKPAAKKKAPTAKKKPAAKKTQPKKADAPATPRKVKTPDLLRGFRDILPEEQGRWTAIRDAVRALADAYSFDHIDLPVLERVELFTRTVGKQTDIVEKEMYTFEEPSGRAVALRPEATASIARAYLNHGMLDRPQPVKLWYEGPMFRHDRPQAGRYRQFHQAGFEVLGVDEPIVDAQLIIIATRIFEQLGLPVSVQINSIGTLDSRKAYLAELVAYMRPHRSKMDEDDKRRLQKSPLRLLDSKDPAIRELLDGAPQIVDWIDEDSKQHFMRVLEFLDELEVPYVLNPHLVRGLDYYGRTVFEFWTEGDEGEKSQTALGGGGRYDGLLPLLGDERETPGCGFAIGIERVARAMAARDLEPPAREPAKVFFAQLGDQARRIGLRVFEDFRRAGIPVAEAFGKNALKSQLELANKLGVAFTLILGQKEVLDGTIIVRDMETGAQEIVAAEKIVPLVEKKLRKSEGVSQAGISPVTEA